MRRLFIISTAFLCCLSTLAQIAVDTLGCVELSNPANNQKYKVIVGTPNSTSASFVSSNLTSTVIGTSTASGARIAIFGDADVDAGSSDTNIGVLGRTGKSAGSFNNYGVWGQVVSGKGIGVYGSIETLLNPPIYGNYAGYFKGDTYVWGALTATSVLTPSDAMLKENITAIDNSENEKSVLDNVLNMNVVKYNYKQDPTATTVKLTATGSVQVDKGVPAPLHFGLLAQELRAIYPNLVVEGQDGNLSINYVELVPVLIQAIKELKQEVDELRREKNTIGDGSMAGIK